MFFRREKEQIPSSKSEMEQDSIKLVSLSRTNDEAQKLKTLQFFWSKYVRNQEFYLTDAMSLKIPFIGPILGSMVEDLLQKNKHVFEKYDIPFVPNKIRVIDFFRLLTFRPEAVWQSRRREEDIPSVIKESVKVALDLDKERSETQSECEGVVEGEATIHSQTNNEREECRAKSAEEKDAQEQEWHKQMMAKMKMARVALEFSNGFHSKEEEASSSSYYEEEETPLTHFSEEEETPLTTFPEEKETPLAPSFEKEPTRVGIDYGITKDDACTLKSSIDYALQSVQMELQSICELTRLHLGKFNTSQQKVLNALLLEIENNVDQELFDLELLQRDVKVIETIMTIQNVYIPPLESLCSRACSSMQRLERSFRKWMDVPPNLQVEAVMRG